MSYSLISRVMNNDLYDKAKFLLSRVNCNRFSFCGKTDTEYHNIMFNGEIDDWVINFDEDAFIFNFDLVLNLLDYMKEHGYHVCGMPDGGVIPIRRHNPIAMNPFFMIINQKFTRQIPFDMSVQFDDSLKEHLQSNLMKTEFVYDNFQSGYYPVYFNLLKHGAKFLYLDAKLLYPSAWKMNKECATTQLMDHLGDPFLIHTWYAREYSKSGFHKTRIDTDWNFAKSKLDSLKSSREGT